MPITLTLAPLVKQAGGFTPKRIKPSNYPQPFATQMDGREKRPLGDMFGLTNFGVNLIQLAPSAVSSLRHAHTTQVELIYILD